MPTRYQVFVSSTYEDLREIREQVIKAVLEMGHIPVGMEMFSAADEGQWSVIRRTIDESDYYVVIVAHRYGSTTPEGISYTEKEYDYAVEHGVPTIAFLLDQGAKWPASMIDKDPKDTEALETFKLKLKEKLVQFWKSKEDLASKIIVALVKLIQDSPRPGWIRGTDSPSASVLNELSRLSQENAELRNKELLLANQARQDADRIIRTLKDTDVEASFWLVGGKDWSDYKTVKLLTIFYLIGPELSIESSITALAGLLGPSLYRGEGKLRTEWPIPRNTIRGWMFDLMSLDLIEPSSRKHPVKDNNQYWSLTPLGRRVMIEVRARLRASRSKQDNTSASSDAAVEPPTADAEESWQPKG